MHHALLGSSMPLMMGLTMAASRKTTNSKPSADTRVTYLLGAWDCIMTTPTAAEPREGVWRRTEREAQRDRFGW